MEKCSSLASWPFYPEPAGASPWALGSFLGGGDDEALITTALRASISSSSTTSSSSAEPTPAQTQAQSRPITSPAMAQTRSGPSGRISKRRPRASRRTPTTYISADPANFRRMVQEVTGISVQACGGRGRDVRDEKAVIRPEVSRAAAAAAAQEFVLPTLDTSAFLLDRAPATAPAAAPEDCGESIATAAAAAAAKEELPAFHFEMSVPCFPTLESWGMI